MLVIFFFQAEDGIRDLVRSRGLGDVYKRQLQTLGAEEYPTVAVNEQFTASFSLPQKQLKHLFLSLIHI